jgi:murein DD-endopeptidase MepM/ murein hydrolase activator NlpD
MRLRSTTLVALVLAALTVGLLTPASASDDRDRKRRVDATLQDLRHDHAHTSKELERATAALARVEGRLPAAQARVDQARQRLAEAERRNEQLKVQLAEAIRERNKTQAEIEVVEAEIEATQKLLGGIARHAYRRSGMGEIAVVLDAQSPQEFTTRLHLVRSALESENAAVDRLESAKAQLAARKAEIEAKRQQIAELQTEAARTVEQSRELRAAAEQAEREVQQLVASAAQAKAAVEAEKKAEERRIAEMEAESARLSAVLAERARKARAAAAAAAAREARERASRAAQRSNGSSSGGSSSSGSSGGSASGGSSGGSSSSSGLSRPVGGYITSSFGMRVHPVTGVYKLHDGTDFGAACGTPIYAAAAGEVIETGYFSAWGNRVVIDHGLMGGDGIATAYNHMTSYAVSSGSRVSRGQLVGYVGTTGYSTGCHLHFNVYRNGTPVDPMGYL